MLASDLHISLPFRPADYDAAGVGTVGIDMDQTAADLGFFTIPFKCMLVRSQLAIKETCAGTTQGQVRYDIRPTAGSDTDRGDGDAGIFKLGTTAAGKILYDESAYGTILEAGQEVVVQLTVQPATGPAGHVDPQLIVVQVPETLANQSAFVATAV